MIIVLGINSVVVLIILS